MRVITEIHKAIKEGRIATPSDEFNDFSMSIAIRLDLIDRLLKRLTNSIQLLSKEVMNVSEEHIFTQDKEGYALCINDDLKLDLLIDIDAFLFEINSCCELFSQYIYEFYTAIGISIHKDKTGQELARILRVASSDTAWFRVLDESRNFFIHNGAPYIALDITDEKNMNIIIMKENLKSFENSRKYITLHDLVNIREGFKNSLSIFKII
ncbi:hypothetical protein [Paenibacillus sp. TY11]|uniref:hypothetical protein n=1 Tax=Paenibacillus sp. TY11 TaxID=3448633 RepID=UPI00403951C5